MKLVPKDYQPPLPVDRFITRDPLDPEAVPMDVVFVGGGPAGLAGAIELASLVKHLLLVHEHVCRCDTKQSGMRHETQCERAQNSRKCCIWEGSDSDMMAPYGGEIE